VVGSSSSDILTFVSRKKIREAAVAARGPPRGEFVLGTETGMVTSIVRDVQRTRALKADGLAATSRCEVVFPVASEAIAAHERAGPPRWCPGSSGR
jgi:quinolinate synthase